MTPDELARINRKFREKDESHMHPIRGRFNVTERAITQARKFRRDWGNMDALEYELLLEQFISEIVNDPKNW